MVVTMNIIEIKNLYYSYKDKIIFDNLNLNIKKDRFTTILGPNGSGKSTLFKLIQEKDKHIKIKTKKINFISTNPFEQIVGKTVKDQLMFYLKQDNIKESIIKRRVKKIVHEFKIKEILDKDPYELNNEQKQIIVLLSNLLSYPELLILDDALCFISTYNKNKILKYLKKQKISIINITNNVEESLFSNQIVIINKKVVLNKPLKTALKEEKLFLDNSLNLPFIVELTLKLKYYNLLDDINLSIDDVVNKIWN